MSGSVTYCTDCGACNWVNRDKCAVCGGALEPTLAEVHAHYQLTDPGFRQFVAGQHKALAKRGQQ